MKLIQSDIERKAGQDKITKKLRTFGSLHIKDLPAFEQDPEKTVVISMPAEVEANKAMLKHRSTLIQKKYKDSAMAESPRLS